MIHDGLEPYRPPTSPWARLPNQRFGLATIGGGQRRRPGRSTSNFHSQTAITTNQAGSLVNIAFHERLGAVPAAATAVQLMPSLTVLADAQAALILSPGISQVFVPMGSVAAVAVPAKHERRGDGWLLKARTGLQVSSGVPEETDTHGAIASTEYVPDLLLDDNKSAGAGSADANPGAIVQTVQTDMFVTSLPAVPTNRIAGQSIGPVVQVSSVSWIDALISGSKTADVVDRVFQELSLATQATSDDATTAVNAADLPQNGLDGYFARLAVESDALADLGAN